ncbi:class A sortase [Lactobacillus sp. ESL0681]|uniref:class A sortase n=1 Tax=Lactobacillus sp. ESL0681 TaxID=2983211 RepID=UPI0023F8D61A|nr:class A sortase [Lactobacillus sp. ESL0681]WEV41307.1 class A sortase [Lactobacillus sp. ESL0681]
MYNEEKHLIRKHRLTTIVGIVTILLLVGAMAIALDFNNLQGEAAHAISSNKTEVCNARHNKQKKKPSYNMEKVKPISPKTLAHAWRYQHDYRAIGQIAIPDKNILLNIYQGVGNDELALGAGTFRANQKMGKNNYPLAGHNMDDSTTYFSPLYTSAVNGTLTKGISIYLTNFKQVFYYKVQSSKFISVNNLQLTYNRKKFAKKPVISLFTCDATGQGRLFIRGRLTGSQSLKSASKYVKGIFEY